MRFRKAMNGDVFDIIKLYQKSNMAISRDTMFLDYKRLERAINSQQGVWMLTEIDGSVCAGISALIDRDQRIAKITRMMVDPEIADSRRILKESLRHFIHYLQHDHQDIDLAYTTTLSMTLDQQELTLEEGFKILGVFPNVMGEDKTKLNGLSAYYFNGTLEEKRQSDYSIHPNIHPFFKISQQQCGLEDLSTEDDKFLSQYMNHFKQMNQYSPLPPLEIVRAKNFVRHRFNQHKKNHSQMSNFYPFYSPDSMIMDPNQDIEIFIRFNRERKFAAIIGEHLNITIRPVELYLAVQQLLKQENISYIEIINDAADSFGVDCILKAGFTPCAYFPAFKRQGNRRRDYIIFGKSFEYLCRPDLGQHPAYTDFYKEYFNIEGKNYFPTFH